MKNTLIIFIAIALGINTVQAQNNTDSIKKATLEGIVVSGTRANSNTPVAQATIDKSTITKRNSGQDIPFILSLTPSFITTSDAGTGVGYTGFRVRGTDANRINITVNNIPLNDAESHGVFFVNMPDFASSLSSVQIQRGVGTSTNGSAAFGASLNMQTENARQNPYAELNSTYGSFNTFKNSAKFGTGLMHKYFTVDGRISGITSDGYVDRASVDLRSYYLSASYLNNKTLLKFITFGGKEKTYQAWNGVDLDLVKNHPLQYNRTYNELGKYTDDKGNVQFYDNQTDNYTQTHYQLHGLQEITSSLMLNVALHYTKGEGYYEEYKKDRKYIEYGLTPVVENGETLKKTDLIRQKWLDNDFYGATFALSYAQNKLKLTWGGGINNYEGEHFGKVIWVRKPNNFDNSKDWYRSSSTKTDANTYLKAYYEILENVFIFSDLQYRSINYKMSGTDDKYDDKAKQMRDITQTHTYSFFNPKVGLNYKINPFNEAYVSFSVANREPNRNNYTDAGVNDKPTSERLYDTELGYRYQSSRFSAGANLYYMKYKDQLILTGKISEIGEALTSNIPDSYRMGIELLGSVKLNNMLRWEGNITLSQNKINNFTEEGIDEYDSNWNWLNTRSNYMGKTDIAYSPHIIANSIATFSYNNFEIAWHSNYVGKQFIDNTANNDRAIDAYFVNNVRLNYTFKLPYVKSIEVGFIVNNLFNEEYETNGYNWYSYYLGSKRVNEKRYFPQAGTNVAGSITIKL